MRVLGKGEREFEASTKATRVGLVEPHVEAISLFVKALKGDRRHGRLMWLTESGDACVTP
jgi:hypothetical protein